MRRLILALVLLFGWATPAAAQVTTPTNFIITAGPCWITTGSGAPSSSNAPSTPCALYIRTNGEVYSKPASSSTWTLVLSSGGALGTPASGTLTNATGLPTAGVTFSATDRFLCRDTASGGAGEECTGAAAATIIGLTNILAQFTGTPTGAKFLRDDGSWQTIPGGGDALTSNPLSQFAATTSAQLAGVLSNETGTDLAVFNTSPSFTTSVTTGSTTFAVFNATATTINAFGAATTVNTGAAATQIWNFGGSTTASELRFLEPSGSGTNYSGFKAQAMAANNLYTLPASQTANGLLKTDGSGALTWVTDLPAGTTFDGDTLLSLTAIADNQLIVGTGANTIDVITMGTGVETALQVAVGSAGAFVTFNGALGTPSSGTLSNATGLPISTGVSGLGSGVATWAATPSIANFFSALTGEASGVETFLTTPSVANLASLLTNEGTGVSTALSTNTNATDGITTPNGTATLTNKTLDVEGTGNVITTTHERTDRVAVCQNVTATLGGNTATTVAPVPVCESATAGGTSTSSDPAFGAATFEGDSDVDTEWHEYWGRWQTGTTGTFQAIIHWRASSTTTNNVVWRVYFGCAAVGTLPSAATYNETVFAADTNNGTTLQLNDTATTTVDTTGCDPGEQAFYRVNRNRATSGDTLDADVQLIGITWIWRRAQ